MNFNQLYDVSLTISPEIVVWPGDPAVQFKPLASIAQGDGVNVTHLNFGSHTGTHVDAPRHFLDGKTGVDAMPLQALVGTAYVLDFTALDHHIGAADLEGSGLPVGAERVLFKTSNSAFWATDPANFHKDYLALALDGAEWLVQRGVKLVGIDYLSIEEFEPPSPKVHYALLGARVVVLEGLNLGEVEAGEYTIFALPVKLENGDGSPTRVLLGR